MLNAENFIITILIFNFICKYLFISNFFACAFLQESEITDMRQTIELLRKQSINAGLTSAHMQSMGVQVNGHGVKSPNSPNKSILQNSSQIQHQQQQLQNQANPQTNEMQNGNGQMIRHHSTDSMCSINSMSSGCSQDKKKKKGWVS